MARRIVPKPDVARIMADVFGDWPTVTGESAALPHVPVLVSCVGRTEVGRCWAPVLVQLGSIPVCEGHLEEVKAAIGELVSADEKFTVVARAVVYYMGDPESGQVKIGTTTQLRHRFMTLSSLRRKLMLLATEPGSRPLERQRHRQFSVLRHSGEWFRKAPLLMEHIGQMRMEHGILLTGDGPMPAWGVAPLRKSSGRAGHGTPQSGASQGERTAV